ncbi:PAS domain-containing sensor histidine kinase [Puteibacter caeruleilacunae]|nr:PAS domain-containing sensor histidine kinase [Puteibacter caeruleilacunae]
MECKLNNTRSVNSSLGMFSMTEDNSLLELFFEQSVNGFFFMMIDNPIEWNDSVDKDEILEYVFDHQRIFRANNKMMELYNAREEDFIGLTPRDFFRHDIEYGKSIIRKLFDKGKLHINTAELKFDGIPMIVKGDYSCIYNEDNRIVGICGIQHEVTERMQMEQSLKESQRQLQHVFNNSPAVMLVLNDEKRIININQTGLEFGGGTFEESIKKRGGEAFGCVHAQRKKNGAGDGKACANCKIKNTVADTFENKRSNHKVEAKLTVLRDGKLEDYNLLVSSIVLTEKPDMTVLVVLDDITSLKKTETQLQHAKDKAEESDRLKSAFLSNMSHEIRTPLNAIIGYSTLINDSDVELNEIKEYVSIISNSGEHLLALISDIMDVSKIESGELSVSFEPIDLGAFLQELNAAFCRHNRITQKKELDIVVDLPRNNIVVTTDRTRLRQVFVNLLGNALKFTERGAITFGYKFNEGTNVFYVNDTGVGIPKDKQEEVFYRFYQLNTVVEGTNNSGLSLKRFGGTGLGLSIAKACVEILGGEIWLESEPGKGTTFYFTIGGAEVS